MQIDNNNTVRLLDKYSRRKSSFPDSQTGNRCFRGILFPAVIQFCKICRTRMTRSRVCVRVAISKEKERERAKQRERQRDDFDRETKMTTRSDGEGYERRTQRDKRASFVSSLVRRSWNRCPKTTAISAEIRLRGLARDLSRAQPKGQSRRRLPGGAC